MNGWVRRSAQPPAGTPSSSTGLPSPHPRTSHQLAVSCAGRKASASCIRILGMADVPDQCLYQKALGCHRAVLSHSLSLEAGPASDVRGCGSTKATYCTLIEGQCTSDVRRRLQTPPSVSNTPLLRLTLSSPHRTESTSSWCFRNMHRT